MILDFFMPGMTGVAAAQVLGRVFPAVPILIVTLYITPQLVMRAKGAGLKGVAQKSDSSQVVTGVKTLLNKGTFFVSKPVEPVEETLR
jgi:DNA-binding NarL/FixJ family response regulator